jgi:polyhydroxybutyrate depolymerase
MIGWYVVFGLLCLLLLIITSLAILRVIHARGEAPVATPPEGTIMVAGVPRTFSLCLPRSVEPGRRYPIIVLLHGGGFQSGPMVARQTGLCDYVDRDHFIAAFPDAEDHQWNDGRSTTAGHGADVAFLNALVDHIATRHGGDRNRAFVAGVSNGGMMTMRMACESSETFRAYMAVVANLPADLGPDCRPSRAVPILIIQSRDDPLMPWAGGELPFAAKGRVFSAPETVSFFAQINGCSGESVTPLPDRVHDGTAVKLHTFRCSRSPVVLYEIFGGGHAWPGLRVTPGPFIAHLVGTVSHQIDATEVMIDFFKANGL